MNFPDYKSRFFSKEEVDVLKTWRKEMEKTTEGIQVIKNFIKDTKVPDNIWMKFLKNLVARIKDGYSGVDAINNTVDKNMLLQGPIIKEKALPDSFSKLLKVRSLMRYLNDNIPIFNDKEGEEELCTLIKKNKITRGNSFKRIKLCGKKPVLWATFTDEIDKLTTIHDDTSDLCDKLGLSDFDKCEHVIELCYCPQVAANIRFPTIMEGGSNPAFRPSDTDDDYGYTWDLKNRDFGLPEVVHEPVRLQDIDSIHYRGHKDRKSDVKF